MGGRIGFTNGVALFTVLLLTNASSISRYPRQTSHEDTFCDSQGEGYHAHPSDCAKFVRCVEQGTGARSDGSGSSILTRFNFYCAPGTVFDARISVCNFPHAVLRGDGGCNTKTAEEIANDADNSEKQRQDDGYMDKSWTTTTIVPTTATTTTTKAPVRKPSPESIASSTESPAEETEPDIEKEPRADEITTTVGPSTSPHTDTSHSPEFADEIMTTTTATNCQCNSNGTTGNRSACDADSGQCTCKKNVQGRECAQCTEGSFNLEADNVNGCTTCFCNGHSTTCEAASGFKMAFLESTFERGTEDWRAEDEHGEQIPVSFSSFARNIGVTSSGGQVYFVAPGAFLGNQRRSFDRNLNFTLRITQNEPPQPASDVILESGNKNVSISIFGEMNPLPSAQALNISLKLNPGLGWKPTLSEFEFQKLLSNLTAIKIRGIYSSQGAGYLDNVILETARTGDDVCGPPANWIENCACPEAYVGTSCEHCAAGYARVSNFDEGSFECVPCNCSGRSTKCDPEFGTCVDCAEGSKGENCEMCTDGYYPNETTGECDKCPCGEHEPICTRKNGTFYCFAFYNAPEKNTAASAGILSALAEKTTTAKSDSETEIPTTTSAVDGATTPLLPDVAATEPVTTTPAASSTATAEADSDKAACCSAADYTDDIDSEGLTRELR